MEQKKRRRFPKTSKAGRVSETVKTIIETEERRYGRQNDGATYGEMAAERYKREYMGGKHD